MLHCNVQSIRHAEQDGIASDVGEGARTRKRLGLAGSFLSAFWSVW